MAPNACGSYCQYRPRRNLFEKYSLGEAAIELELNPKSGFGQEAAVAHTSFSLKGRRS